MWGDVGRCREIERAEALEALHTRHAAALGLVFPGYHPKVFPGCHPRHAAALEQYLPYISPRVRTSAYIPPYISLYLPTSLPVPPRHAAALEQRQQAVQARQEGLAQQAEM